MASIAPAHYLPAPPGRRPVFAFSHLRSKASRGASALSYYSSQAGQVTLGPFMLGPSPGPPSEGVVGVVLCFMLESASIGHGQLPCPVLHQSQDTVPYPSDMVYVSLSLLPKSSLLHTCVHRLRFIIARFMLRTIHEFMYTRHPLPAPRKLACALFRSVDK